MASKVNDILKVIGRRIPDAGAHLYHAADGVSDGGFLSKDKRHRMRKELHKLRLRATGMTDDLIGSKETQGAYLNPFEQNPPKD